MFNSTLTRRTPLKRSQRPLVRRRPLRSTGNIAARPTRAPSATKARKVPDLGPKLWSMKKADDEFSRFIRDRDRKCFFCPNRASQNSHFWGRGNWTTRFDTKNCDGICGGCHMRHEGNKQGLYRTMKIEQLGQETYDALARKAAGTTKKRFAIAECMELLSTVRITESS